ncbi:MAG: two-component regulator propeller domain-containing protein [Ignavibacteriaceae bacterium]
MFDMLLHFISDRLLRKYLSKTLNPYFLLFKIFFIAATANLYSQSSNLVFEQLFLQHGLSQSIVKCIAQDKEGFLYFGTEDGLNRYDGYTFTVMRNNPEDTNSLSYNDINSIFI